MAVTKANLERAIALRLDIDYAASMFTPEDVGFAYDRATDTRYYAYDRKVRAAVQRTKTELGWWRKAKPIKAAFCKSIIPDILRAAKAMDKAKGREKT